MTLILKDHEFVEVRGGWQCAVCGKQWGYKPKHLCPGLPQYTYGEWPENLMTQNQLSAAGYQTGRNLPPVAAVVYRSKSPGGWMRLYDPAQAKAKRPVSDAQRASLAQARKLSRREYQCALQAQAILNNPNTVILDTETTGLFYDAEVFQLAVINHCGETLLDTLVQPLRPDAMLCQDDGVSAYDIHGIHPDHLRDAPTFPDVWQLLRRLVDGKQLVIYNADYDMGVLRFQEKEHGLPGIAPERVVCAMLLKSEYTGRRWYQGGYRWQPLDGGDHSALGDCLATLATLRGMVKAEIDE